MSTQKNITPSLAKMGMNKDSHISNLPKEDYTDALNSNFYDESGNGFNIQNEHSNILASKFKEGYVVVGLKNDVNIDTTYYFLKNTINGASEIGYIENINTVPNLSDTIEKCSDCNFKVQDSILLEKIEEAETQKYTKLLNDCCGLENCTGQDLCLNFNIDFPIKGIEIKNEKCGKVLYWTDNLNPPRYLNLDDINSYQSTGEEICGDDSNVTPVCVDCDKLKIFKEPQILNLQPAEIVLGGNLKRGIYQATAAYCDESGNEQSRYFNITTPVSIFDEQNNILSQPEIADRTNFAIRFTIDNLDLRFTHYKVVIIQQADINRTTTHYVEGIHSTSDNTILYTTEQNKKVSSIDEIIKPAIQVEKWETLTSSNNYLFGSGVTYKKVPNLQKVVNLLGIFLQWQTHIAKEDLYKNGVASAKNKTYLRDETYPLGIRFLEDGEYTPLYHFINRPKNNIDAEIIDNADTDSINKLSSSGGSCIGGQYNERWQVYNTSEEIGRCGISFNADELVADQNYEIVILGDTDWTSIGASDTPTVGEVFTATGAGTGTGVAKKAINTQTLTEPVTLVEEYVDPVDGYLDQILNGSFSLDIEEGELFTTIEEFINNNREEILNTTYPVGSTLESIQSLLTLSNYEADNATPSFGDNCDVPPNVRDILEEEVIEVLDVVGETLDFIPAVFPEDYTFIKPQTDLCDVYDRTGNNSQNREQVFTCDTYSTDANRGSQQQNFIRSKTPYENRCSEATTLQVYSTESPFAQTNFINYFFALGTDNTNLLTNKNAASGITSNWLTSYTYPTKINKNAEWYTIKDRIGEEFIIDITRLSNFDYDYFSSKEVRFSLYKSCSNSVDPILTTLYQDTSGIKLLIKTNTNGNLEIEDGDNNILLTDADGVPDSDSYYISLDTPSLGLSVCGTDFEESLKVFNESTEQFEIPTRVSLSLAGCYSIGIIETRDKRVDVDFDTLTTKKIQTFITPCDFEVPVLEDNCEPVAHKHGKFGYSESTEEYSDNKELYDSTEVKVNPADLLSDDFDNDNTFREYFENTFTNGVDSDGNYILTDEANFQCKNIRHFKFPDNKVSPFMYENPLAGFTESLIYPLGITINERQVRNFLDVAVRSGLITEERRKGIKGYEIVRGDRKGNESIVARGLTYDMYRYTEKQRDINYANYPFNSLGQDIMHYNSPSRSSFIDHPNNSNSNSLWTFTSPDTDYQKINLPNTIKVDGYMYGQSIANIKEVEEHPKWTILGDNLKDLATTLALLEVAAESALNINNALANTNSVAGTSTTVFPGGLVAAGIIAGFEILSGVIFRYARYKYQWLETFRNLGKRRNFSAFLTGHGYYNYFQKNTDEGNSLRYLNLSKNIKKGRLILSDTVDGERVEINHRDREDTVLLSTGSNHPIVYNNTYKTFDNSTLNQNNSSRTFASAVGACTKGLSEEIRSNIASMYTTLKNFRPSQYGTIGSIKWIPTGYVGDLTNPRTDCLPIFGGDSFITRHTLRRPFSFFNTTAMNQADMTPFEYKFYSMIGKEPRFFVNFGITENESRGGSIFPMGNSEYSMDCEDSGGSYVKEPSKFYLYYNGIPDFLVESSINTWNRYAGPEPWNNFYPNVGDYMQWTEESVNSVRRGNKFLYNQAYSDDGITQGVQTLPVNYNQEEYDCRTDMPNGTMYSLPDNSENRRVDPWLTFRPNDKYEFPTDYGDLIELRGIETAQILGRFTKQSVIFNAVDELPDDGQAPSTRVLGDGGIFSRRPRTFSNTDLGYTGSQNFQMVSNEFGHFYVDAMRGQIFHIKPGGSGMSEISAQNGDKPSGMKNWFKEHLPFKILEHLSGVDIDNPYNGVGISMGWDSRYRRVFITKKDYIPDPKQTLEVVDGVIVDSRTKQRIDYSTMKDVSWTLSYNLDIGRWGSRFSFKPNYYVSHNNYFQTGINVTQDDTEKGVWSHLLTNKSYQVFYGKAYEWEIEIPVQNQGTNKYLESFTYNLDARRYFNEYDYAQNKGIGFEEAVIFNHSNNSGTLKLDLQRTMRQVRDYPKTEGNSQRILQTQQDGQLRFNYFYNRVKNERSGLPLFNWDENQLDKEINNQAISFFNKKVLERLRGDSFLVNLKSTDTKHKKIFKLALTKENLYS